MKKPERWRMRVVSGPGITDKTVWACSRWFCLHDKKLGAWWHIFIDRVMPWGGD